MIDFILSSICRTIIAFFTVHLYFSIFNPKFSKTACTIIMCTCYLLSVWANFLINSQSFLYSAVKICIYFLLLDFLFVGGKLKKLVFIFVLHGIFTLSMYFITVMDNITIYFFKNAKVSSSTLITIFQSLDYILGVIVNCLLLLFLAKLLKDMCYESDNTHWLMLLIPVIFITTSIDLAFLYNYRYGVREHLESLFPSVTPLVNSFLMAAFAIAGIVVTIIILFYSNDRMKAMLLKQHFELQTAHNKQIGLSYSKTLRIQHDIRNHLSCLKSLLSNSKTAEAHDYLEAIVITINNLGTEIVTGNLYADAVLNEKYNFALSKSIAFKCEIKLPGNDFILPTDICIILGNALDNAIEAQNDLVEEKFIQAKSIITRGFLIIEIKNSISPFITSIKPGIGLHNLETTIRKYNGVIELDIKPRIFTLSAMLPFTV